MLGSNAFGAGTRLYFSRYRNANANTDQFFECFEEVSGISLATFKKKWMEQPGYARVTARTQYDAATQSLTVPLRQDLKDGEEPFPVPVSAALVNAQGRDMHGTCKIHLLSEREQSFTFSGLLEEPAFVSLKRNASFYGTFDDATADETFLQSQTLRDLNAFNRVEAFRKLTHRERFTQITAPGTPVSNSWLHVYRTIFHGAILPWALKAAMLRIDEQPLDRRYAAWFPELVRAREILMQAVSSRFHEDLAHAVHELRHAMKPEDALQVGIQKGELYGVLVDLLAVADTPAVHEILLDHLDHARTATERFRLLIALNRSSWKGRLELLEQTYRQGYGDVTGYANYLKVVALGTHPDLWHLVEKEKKRPGFDTAHLSVSRALLVAVATNTKRVWTEEGIDWIRRHVVDMASMNANIAAESSTPFNT